MRSKKQWIQVKVDEQEKEELRQAAEEYGTTISGLIRALAKFAVQKKPRLTLAVTMEPAPHKGKGEGNE